MKMIKFFFIGTVFLVLTFSVVSAGLSYSNLNRAVVNSKHENWVKLNEIPHVVKMMIESSEGETYWKSNYMTNLLFKSESPSEHKKRSLWLNLITFNIYDKEKLQESYLNLAYFGDCKGSLIQGIKSASGCMLNKNIDSLSIAEAAYFAIVVRSPSRFLKDHVKAKSGRDDLLRKAHSTGKISSSELEQALSEDVPNT